MNMTLVGMAPREAAALTLFVGVGMKGWSCRSVTARPGVALPGADLYVLDLAGVGLAQWSARVEGDLLNLLAGRNALLLVAASNSTWHGKLPGNGRQKIVCLSKPYNTQALRRSLAQCIPEAAAQAPARSSTLGQAGGLGQPSARAALHQPDIALPPSPTTARTTPPARPAPSASTYDSVRALRMLFPALNEHLLLGALLNLIDTDEPHELRLSVHHAIVMHPAQGWVAHNATPQVLERLAKDGSAVSSMSVRALEGDEVLQRVSRVGVTSGSLDTFLWRMAELSMGGRTPAAQGNAELRLRAMPGFTRITGVSNLYLQLAAICVRLPQTLASLKAAFAQHDPRDIERFMLLSTVCGLGQLRLMAAAAPAVAAQPAPVSAAGAVRAGRAGFMRSLLNKLF